MATWPTGLPKPAYGTKEKYHKPQLRTDFTAGYVQTRPLALRGRRYWPELGWQLMSEANFQILQSFFYTNQGNSFTWTHPITAEALTCVFSSDEIESEWTAVGWRGNVKCPIEEL